VTSLDEVREAAIHGSYCPKMCNFACPVLAATGREGAAPWGLHVSVSALATGQRPLDADAYDALRGCTGCYACRAACLYDLDVPREVRAARAAVVSAGGAPSHIDEVVGSVVAGTSPYRAARVELPLPPEDGSDVAVVIGCADGQASVDAVAALLDASGIAARFAAPAGCCGALLSDLGADDAAETVAGELRSALGTGVGRVVATDPHCLPQLRALTRLPVVDVVTELAAAVEQGRLDLDGGAVDAVVVHDPCVLAREEGVTGAPRALLAAAGIAVVEPEGSGEATVCSGAGLAFDLIDRDEADLVAVRRARQLDHGRPVATSCARAARRLAGSGLAVSDLVVLLAESLEGGTS
jgi:Fe-S oxidoreductase